MGFSYFLHSSFPNGALIGGFVGLISSGALNLKKYQEENEDTNAAGIAIGKEAVGTGLATGVATAAAGTFGHGLILMTGTALVVGVAVKYLWDAGMEKLEQPTPEAEAG